MCAAAQDHKLCKALQDYENEKWRIIAHKVGSGSTSAACRERAEQLAAGGGGGAGGDEAELGEPLWQSLSPKAASLPETMEMAHTQRPW